MKDHSAARGAIRVLVADNTRIHTQLLAEALRRDSGLHVASSDSGLEHLIAQASRHDFDVLVISSNLEEEGLDGLRAARAARQDLLAVVLLDSSKRETVLEAFRAGARGLFTRQESIETLGKCVRSVYQGQIWANSEQMAVAVEALACSPPVRAVNAHGLNVLSDREMEVVRCLAEGLTNRQIADRLKLSQHTVKNYLFRVFDKLGVSSRVELLFMTLSQANQSRSLFQRFLRSLAEPGFQDENILVECRKAAEQGVPLAQVALAQMHGARNADSKDLMQACMWYLIASEQISQVYRTISEAIPNEQLVQAELMAADWLGKTRQRPPQRVKHEAGGPIRIGTNASSA